MGTIVLETFLGFSIQARRSEMQLILDFPAHQAPERQNSMKWAEQGPKPVPKAPKMLHLLIILTCALDPIRTWPGMIWYHFLCDFRAFAACSGLQTPLCPETANSGGKQRPLGKRGVPQALSQGVQLPLQEDGDGKSIFFQIVELLFFA